MSLTSFTSFGQVIPVLGPNLGFPGTVSRQGERVIAARQLLSTTANPLTFGAAAVIVPSATGGTYQSVADYVATIANVASLYKTFAGFAVREVKTQLTYPVSQTPGTLQVGNYAQGQIAEVLERGSITVTLAVGSPNTQDQVYTRVVANSAVPNGTLGDIETNPAASDLFTVAATTTEGSTAVTLASGTNTVNGQLISGVAFAPGTYIVSGGGTTSIVISQAAIATFATTGGVATISNLFAIPYCVVRTGAVDSNNIIEVTLKERVAA